jgi:nucleoside-diphosphate-sugar epimerase
LPDFVISGAGGFIGAHLSSALAARGFAVSDYRAFRDGDARAGTFVHCANIHDNSRDNAAFTADVLATVGPRVRRFVQLQTFATLHGGGRLAPARFNFGKQPLLMAPYPFGKLLQEHVLCRDAEHYPALAVRLVYLPAVLGEGGSWSAVIAAARQNGVVLPPLMRASARANHIEVADLADHLAATAGDGAPGIARAILNRPASAKLTWRAFFAGARVTDDASVQGMAKLAATEGALAAYRLMTAVRPPHLPPGAIDRRPPRPPGAREPRNGRTAEPVRFTGLIAHIVRTQPYIPGS